MNDNIVMEIYFGSDSKNIFIAEADTWEQAIKCMNDYLKQINFKSYYMRCWMQNEKLVVDYGSHVNFFYITNVKF